MMETEAKTAQRDTALAEANRIRSARKEIKQQLAHGGVELADLIMDPPDEILTAEIGDVLEWAPGIGRFRAGKILSNGHGGPIVGRAVKLEHLSTTTRQRIIGRIGLTTPVRVAA